MGPKEMKDHIGRHIDTLRQIYHGLDGDTFSWNDSARVYHVRRAEAAEITLMTKTALKKKGYRLKRGAKPVGYAYYKAPLSKKVGLYIVECQCNVSDEL
ncbi:MAG: hypothetical protein GY795_44750 [Desulfobacterales bacterium]|nr:hypothetical protein [Desulfobacterales bacterium]